MRAAGGEEGAATDNETAPLIAQTLGRFREAAEGAAERKSGDQAAQLRITAEDVRLWLELGERCKRVEFHY